MYIVILMTKCKYEKISQNNHTIDVKMDVKIDNNIYEIQYDYDYEYDNTYYEDTYNIYEYDNNDEKCNECCII